MGRLVEGLQLRDLVRELELALETSLRFGSLAFAKEVLGLTAELIVLAHRRSELLVALVSERHGERCRIRIRLQRDEHPLGLGPKTGTLWSSHLEVFE